MFIFSIVLGAKYLSYVKSIETHARAFLTLNILSIGTVCQELKILSILKEQPKPLKINLNVKVIFVIKQD